MSHRWYYQMLLEEFGPVTQQQLQQLIDEGTLSADDLVRPETSTEWFAVGTLEGHIAAVDAGPAEITDLSELSFSFEQSNPTRQQVVPVESKSPASDPTGASDRQAPAFFELPEVDSDVYFCQSLGQILGPLPLTELVGLAESGSLSAADLVRCGDAGPWQPASDISELSATFMLMDHGSQDTIATLGSAKNGSAKNGSTQFAAPEVRTPQTIDSIPAATPPQPEIPAPSQSAANIKSESPAAGKKVRRKKSKKEDDQVLDEIFDDVFAKEDDEKPSRVASSALPQVTTPTSVPQEHHEAAKSIAPASPGVSSAYSSTNKSTAAAASAAMARATASHSRSKVSFSFDGPVRVIAIGILLTAVVGGLIWQFGLPSIAFGGPSVSRIADRVSASVADYKALGDKPSLGQWQGFCQATRSEFLPHYKSLVESGASGKKEVACMEGIKGLIAMTSMKLEDLEPRKELLAKIEQHLAAMK